MNRYTDTHHQEVPRAADEQLQQGEREYDQQVPDEAEEGARVADGLIMPGPGCSKGTPDGLEAAAVAHHHRRSGGTQLSVFEIDVEAGTVALGNFPGVRATYKWSARSDCNGFRFVEVNDDDDVLERTIEHLEQNGYPGNLDGGRIVVPLPEADAATAEEDAEAEADDLVRNIKEILLWEGAPEVLFRVEWEKSDSYVAIIELI